jgi:hypothetical protein
MSEPTTPGTLEADLRALAAGLKSDPPGGQANLVVEGKSFPIDQLVTDLVAHADVIKAAADAALVHQTKLEERDKELPTMRAKLQVVRASVKGALGKKNPDLAKFGMEPDKDREPLTVEEKAKAVAKSKATRAARHPKGV